MTGLHASGEAAVPVWMLPALAAQAVCLFACIRLIVVRPELTVRLDCLGRWAKPFHRVCRRVAVVALAGLVAIDAGLFFDVAFEALGLGDGRAPQRGGAMATVSVLSGALAAFFFAGSLHRHAVTAGEYRRLTRENDDLRRSHRVPAESPLAPDVGQPASGNAAAPARRQAPGRRG